MPSLRYVVLRHEQIAEPHFDLMFESAAGEALRTFRVEAWPIAREMALVPLGDHRRDYLEYEGPVSRNRGVVRRVESGMYELRGDWQNSVHLSLLPHGTALTIEQNNRQWTIRRRG